MGHPVWETTEWEHDSLCLVKVALTPKTLPLVFLVAFLLPSHHSYFTYTAHYIVVASEYMRPDQVSHSFCDASINLFPISLSGLQSNSRSARAVPYHAVPFS